VLPDFINQPLLFGLIGGLGLLLFGMKIMSEALQKIAGDRLRRLFASLTNSRLMGVFTGAVVTAIVQSSNATAVMVVGFVNAGLMSIVQALCVLLGANIGTTVTAQLLAFDIGRLALPAIGIGSGLKLLCSNRRWSQYGEVVLGLGILFLGLTITKDAFVPIKNNASLHDFLLVVSQNQLLAVALGALLTLLIQSSSVTIGLTLALAGNGLLPFDFCIALILGGNIGTACSANIASLKTNLAARRTALAHLLFNLVGVAYILLFFPYFLHLVDWLTPGDPEFVVNTPQLAAQFGAALGDKPFIARHIANSHTLFNLINALVFLFLLPQVARLTTLLIRGHLTADSFHLQYLDSRVLNTPILAISQAQLETRRMAHLGLRVFDQTLLLLPGYKEDQLSQLRNKEHFLDLMQREITEFLVKLSQQSITREVSRQAAGLMHIVNDLERLGDHCEDLRRLFVSRIDRQIEFSEAAIEELEELTTRTRDFLFLAVRAIDDETESLNMEGEERAVAIFELEVDLRNNHIHRLSTGECSTAQGLLFIDILHHVGKVGEHVGNITRGIRGNC
jgi:phosphate:Na+ symporter